ncbi:MAG TPA: hypothetical protein VMU93_01895 [Caulobacteraceae bacterium]|nr:hypothetical protein [Caulobacteraceae bacterium]
MLWLRTPQAKAELRIPPDLNPVAAICLGYAASVPDATQRPRPRLIWDA